MKKILCLALVFLLSLNFITPLSAGLYNTYFETLTPITANLNYISYVGEDSASYSQSVHILEFTPGKETLPYVTWGSKLLSVNTVSSMLKGAGDKGINAVAGVNGDFYSFYTGIPMSAVISEGRVVSSDAGNNAIGFTTDSSVIVGAPEIVFDFSFDYFCLPEKEPTEEPTEETTEEATEETTEEPTEEATEEATEETTEEPTEEATEEATEETTEEPTEEATEETTEEPIEEPVLKTYSFQAHYNKYPTVYALYLTDSNYSSSTASAFASLEIVLKPNGQMRIGEQVEFSVEGLVKGEGNTAIPTDSMVLTVPDVLKDSAVFENLKIGDVLNLNISARDGWEKVETAIGGGDVFVVDSTFVPETVNEEHEKYRNARNAVGIREDGTVFFAAIDGDSKNGAGMTLSALADFMIGEGAVTALNLDGGGSVTVAVSFPSEDSIKIVNHPKDGTSRRVSNALLFVNSSSVFYDAAFADFNTYKAFLLAGSSFEIKHTLFNGAGSPITPKLYEVIYTPSETDAFVEDTIYHAADKTYTDRLHALFVFQNSELEGETVVNVTNIIDTLELSDSALVLEAGDVFELSVTASRFGIPVFSTPEAFHYSVKKEDIQQTLETSEPTDVISKEETLEGESEFLFENEYITLSKDGMLTAKEAPLFTELEFCVAYKDREATIKLYFGKQSEVLEDFESEELQEEFTDPTQKGQASGYRSNKALVARDGTASYVQPKKLDIMPKYFTLFIKDSYQNNLNVAVRVEGQVYLLPYYVYKDYSSISGWVELIAPIPENLTGEIEILSPVVSLEELEITIDCFMAHYGWNSDPFADISGIWSRDYIMTLYDMGVVNGYLEDGVIIFKPDNNITRAEFAKMLASYLALDTKRYTSYGTEFADEESIAEWASEYIKALSNEGYMNGKSTPEGEIIFDSDSFITRAEAMHVFAKLIEGQDSLTELDFSDSAEVQSWALESVKKVVSAGIVTGFDDGTLRAGAPITRAQMCTMFTRLWDIKK